MPPLEIHIDGLSVAVLFGILQGILIFLFLLQQKRSKEHQYLLYFMGVLLFVQLHSFLVRSGAMAHVLFLFNSNTPFIFLFGPLIWLYSRSLSGSPVTRRTGLIHFLPFAFYLCYSFFFFLQPATYKLKVLGHLMGVELTLPPVEQPFSIDPWGLQGWVVVEILSVHLIAYGLFTIFTVKGKQDGQPESGNRFSHWITFMNGLLILGGMVLFLAEGGVINGWVFFKSPFPQFSSDLFSTFCLYALTFYLLIRPECLNTASRKYHKSSLSSIFMKEKLPAIKKIMEDDKLFLDSNFSLDLMAQRSGLSKHHISQIINSELNCNFFDFTNRYRIEEAKRVLQESQEIKMEQLAYQLGYKSKSSFFNAFKKATNLTPSRYLMQMK